MAYLRTERGTLEAEQSEPLGNISHIITDVLYPAVNDQLGGGKGGLVPSTIGPNGSTVTSSKYGTVQIDGNMYYYTDIEGSKPIKDPRIGAFFGSQRYMITSVQLNVDETGFATGAGGTASGAEDQRVYSIDGREFFRFVGAGNAGRVTNDSKGLTSQMPDLAFIEITGYFNQANLLMYTYGYTRTMTITLDGEGAYNGFNANSNKDTPLRGRWLHSGHVFPIPLTAADSNLAATPTLGIHTLKFLGNAGQGSHYPTGVELIAQDLTSTATKSQIQIPNQNVVSHGKKFAISAAAHHYNPFGTKGDDSASTIPNNTTGDSVATGWAGSTSAYWDSTLDTATSIGLNAWQHSVTFDDSGDTDHTITVGGNSHHSGYENQIGTMGMSFDGSGDYLSTPQSTDWQFGTGDFTVEFWMNWNTKRSSECAICYGSGNGVEGWKLLVQTADATWYGGSSGQAFSTSAHGMVAGRWYHWAIARVSGTVTAYRDGTAIGSVGSSGDMPATSSYGVWIATTGGGASGTQQYNGYLDEIRISKGLARYTGNFTPSTTAFTSDSNTQLLIHSGDATTVYYRPVNGGRVVKWVDSSGNIKTSVNMMPPAARTEYSGHTGDGRPTGHENWSTGFKPIIMKGEIDPSQAEVAKTFHWREFGNGSGNQGSGTGTSLADCTMLGGANDNVSYTMDDGLTTMAGFQLLGPNSVYNYFDVSPSDYYWLTFIGTGFSMKGMVWAQNSYVYTNFVQNLPYGSHIFQCSRSGSTITFKIDDVTIKSASSLNNKDGVEFTIHQPKRPPIPEDAVVLSDYMLMADFVPQSGTSNTNGQISKGTRKLYNSRDCFYAETSGNNITFDHGPNSTGGFEAYQPTASGSDNIFKVRFPSFATNYVAKSYQSATRGRLYIDNTAKTGGNVVQDTGGNYESYGHLASNEVLGVQNWGISSAPNQNCTFTSVDFAIPIHTSSHYQAFETQYTHDLVGGDRNMEQTNLVVTPDGKTWDEVTRNTSYLGNIVLSTSEHNGTITATSSILDLLTDLRGSGSGDQKWNAVQKDSFVVGHDRYICLKDGMYLVEWYVSHSGTLTGYLLVNTTSYSIASSFYWNVSDASYTNTFKFPPLQLKRGDWLMMTKPGGTITATAGDIGCKFTITKLRETAGRGTVIGSTRGARKGKWAEK